MRKFIAINPYCKVPNDLYPIDCAPSLNYEVYLFSRKEVVTFEEVIDILLHSFYKTDILGAASLIYYKYYNEFYTYLQTVSTNESLKKKHNRRIRVFYKHHLSKWMKALVFSDDTMYPQNDVLRNINKLIEDKYLN